MLYLQKLDHKNKTKCNLAISLSLYIVFLKNRKSFYKSKKLNIFLIYNSTI